MSWFRRLFPGPPPREALEVGAPIWASELTEILQKTARAQAKLAVKLDDLSSRVDGGFTHLEAQHRRTEPVAASGLKWDDLLDAMDLLETAAGSSEAQANPALAEGLQRVLLRLERMLSQGSLERRAARGVPADGRLFRVVGAHEEPSLPDGVVSRVVRAAVVSGDRIIREGEVLTNRRST